MEGTHIMLSSSKITEHVNDLGVVECHVWSLDF